MTLSIEQFAVSPCSNPELPLDEALARYSEMGFRKFEAFTSYTTSALDWRQDPAIYRQKAKGYGMEFVSMHLPPVKDDRDASLQDAIAAARFARGIGSRVVLFKATSRANYIAAAKPFLDATCGLGITPVLQNHFGTPISTLADFSEVISGIADPRMKTLFEVGHFHSAGVLWRDGYNLLKGSIALVHFKDQIGRTPVAFGEGEVDLRGMFRHMTETGYAGDYIVEMEAALRDTERSLQLLRDARIYIKNLIEEINS